MRTPIWASLLFLNKLSPGPLEYPSLVHKINNNLISEVLWPVVPNSRFAGLEIITSWNFYPNWIREFGKI